MKHLTTITLFFVLISHVMAQKSDTISRKVYIVPSISVNSTLAGKKSPTTYSEFDKQTIKEKNSALDIGYVLSEMPSIFSVSQNGNNIGYTSISLRGFDQRRIAVMVNGVPQNDPEDHNVYWINMPDIASSSQSIQVQRGAGLMNYGSAAMAGSINVQTISGASESLIRCSQFMGFQQQFNNNLKDDTWIPSISKSSIEVQSGLINSTYAMNARLTTINSQGSRFHSWSALQSYFVSATRFDNNATTQINVYGGPIADALAYTGIPKEWIKNPLLQRSNLNGWGYDSTGNAVLWSAARRQQEIENFTQPHIDLLNDIQLDENLSLKSTLFYYTGNGFFDYDASWADASTLRLTPEYGFPQGVSPSNTLITGFVGNKQFGWIPRLVWNHTQGTFTMGAELRSHSSIHWGKIRFAEQLPQGIDPDFKIYEYEGARSIMSVFGREQWQYSDDLSFIAEAQLVHHTYSIDQEKAGNRFTSYTTIQGNTIGNGDKLFTTTFLFLNPRIGAFYTIDDAQSVRFSLAYTSREPRMRNLYAAEDAYFGAQPLFQSTVLQNGTIAYDFSAPLVKPEHMLNAEIGWNYSNSDFKMGITFYAMEFYNELVKSGRLDIFGMPIDGNAPRTEHLGLEVECSQIFKIKAHQSFEVNGNLTYSKNRIIDYTYYTGLGEAISLANNRIAGFPDLMGFVKIAYRNSHTVMSLNMKTLGGFKTDNFGDMIVSDNRIIQDLNQSFSGYYTDNTVDAYTVFGADIQHEITNLSDGIQTLRIKIQAINLLDTLYASGGEGKEFFPGQRRTILVGVELDL